MKIGRIGNLSASEKTEADKKSGFIFDHLPKTGGTALRLAFEQIFGADKVSPPVLGRTERWAEKNFSSYKMIVGHFHAPIPVAGTSERRIRLTILREPIDRAVSEYFYYRNDVDKIPWHNLAVYSKEHDLYGYVKLLEAQGDIAVSNRYAHHFAAQLSRGPWREKELLSRAKEAIANYDFVGIQEQLADSLDLFCCAYGLPLIPEMTRTNVTSVRTALREIDSGTRDRLIRLNRVDLELYEFVRSRFQDRKREIFRRFARRETAAAEVENASDVQEQENVTLATRSRDGSGSFGDQAVEFCSVRVSGNSSGDAAVRSGEIAFVSLTIDAHIDVPNLTVGIHIADDVGEIVFGTNTHILGEGRSVTAGKKYEVVFAIKADVRHGRYFVGGSLHTGASHADRCFHWCERLAKFDVVDGANGPFVGYCRLETKVEWEEVSARMARA